MAAKILTVTEVSEVLGTDPRTTRKFLRSITPKENHPGKGSRWGVAAKDMRSVKAKYAKYAEALAAKGDDDTPEGDDA